MTQDFSVCRILHAKHKKAYRRITELRRFYSYYRCLEILVSADCSQTPTLSFYKALELQTLCFRTLFFTL